MNEPAVRAAAAQLLQAIADTDAVIARFRTELIGPYLSAWQAINAALDALPGAPPGPKV